MPFLHPPLEIILTIAIAFFAGLIDAIAGGGGLIQLPGLLWVFPTAPVIDLLGSNKLASGFGTLASSLHYIRKLKINFKQVLPAMCAAFLFSLLGGKLATLVDNHLMKPIIFGLLLLIGTYTLLNKHFGVDREKRTRFKGVKLGLASTLIGGALGLYDGFFGPGTGSFLIFCFVSWLGFDFLTGAAFSKLTNLASNVASIIFFGITGHILYSTALSMAIFNVLGNMLGARLATKNGSKFVRWVFLAVVAAILIQFTYRFFRLP